MKMICRLVCFKKIQIILSALYLLHLQHTHPFLFILYHLRNELDSYWTGGKTKDFSKKYRGKTFVNDVEYEVNEESATADPEDDRHGNKTGDTK